MPPPALTRLLSLFSYIASSKLSKLYCHFFIGQASHGPLKRSDHTQGHDGVSSSEDPSPHNGLGLSFSYSDQFGLPVYSEIHIVAVE